jgi:hypothetical protein
MSLAGSLHMCLHACMHDTTCWLACSRLADGTPYCVLSDVAPLLLLLLLLLLLPHSCAAAQGAMLPTGFIVPPGITIHIQPAENE